MKGFKQGMVWALALVVANISFAGVIVDTVTQTESVGWFGSYAYQHDLNDNDGFVLGNVTGGLLEVSVWDDSTHWLDGRESILFTVEKLDGDTGGITFGSSFSGDLEFDALAALNDDGFLDIKIKSLFGDFYVGNSVLTLYTAVAEPGALGLLVLGLAMVIFTRPTKAKKFLV
ncbi:hypothetical protein [Reinekea sp.]|jgi:hypothetical protein|uniref:hypothetical protein n=1 Tax=Reinekea sp. TaxID=1970455 RepID=UPI002A7F6F4A|nr:hypothetical protein [Reinekea sp.]